MNAQNQSFWQRIFRRETAEAQDEVPQSEATSPNGDISALDIAPNDPLLAYILNSPGVIEVDELNLESATLQDLREAGVKISFPLVRRYVSQHSRRRTCPTRFRWHNPAKCNRKLYSYIEFPAREAVGRL